MKERLILTFALALVMLFQARSSAGQEGSEGVKAESEEIDLYELLGNMEVEAVSKFIQLRRDASANVTVITHEEIEELGYRTIGEVLAGITGFHIDYDRNYQYIGSRGLAFVGDYNSRIVILINGHSMKKAIDLSTPIGTDFGLDLENIQSVEVVKGPASIMHGSSSIFAVVNIKTFTGESSSTDMVQAEYGSFDHLKGSFRTRHVLPHGIGMTLSLSAMDREGDDLYYPEYDDPLTNDGMAAGMDGEGYRRIYSTISRKNLFFHALWNSREKSIPTGSYETIFNDPDNSSTDRQSFIELKYKMEIHPGHDIRARVFHDTNYYTGRYDYDEEGSEVESRDYYDAKSYGGEASYFAGLLKGNLFGTGLEFQRNYRVRQWGWYGGPEDLYVDENPTYDNWAVWLNDNHAISSAISVEAGIRYDSYSTFGSATSYRGALILNPLPATSVKLITGRGFRAPSPYEMYYTDESTMAPNRELEAEQISTFEAIVEQGVGERILLTLAAYRHKMEDAIVETSITSPYDETDNVTQFNNLEEFAAHGIEIGADFVLPGNTRLKGAYAWQDAGEHVPELMVNSPANLATASVRIPVFRGRGVMAAETRFVGGRRTLAGTMTDEYSVTNATFTLRDIAGRLDLFFSVYNLFDEEYFSVVHANHIQDVIAQDGTTLRLKAELRF